MPQRCVRHGNQVLVGIFTDLTALRATQRELEAANQRLHDPPTSIG